MLFSKITSAVALAATFLVSVVNALPEEKLQALTPISGKSCPKFTGTFEYFIQIDQEDLFTNNYSFDGTLFHASDGAFAGFVSTGCQVSHFLTNLYGEPAGPCVTEIALVENDDLLAVVTASGTSIFGFKNLGSTLTVTGGDVCTLGKVGNVVLVFDTLTLTLS